MCKLPVYFVTFVEFFFILMCAENYNAVGKWKHWIIWQLLNLTQRWNFSSDQLTKYLEIKSFKLGPKGGKTGYVGTI